MTTRTNLVEELKKNFGFDTFKGNQEAIIRNLLDGKDTFVLMPTGGGKSLCYQLPSLLLDGTAIVISPLIALMKNQVDAMRNFSEEDGVAHFINSSLNKAAIDQVKDDIMAGRTKLLYVAPESLTKEENIEFYHPSPILCTDNAVMIGSAAYYEYINGKRDGWDLNAIPNLKLGER